MYFLVGILLCIMLVVTQLHIVVKMDHKVYLKLRNLLYIANTLIIRTFSNLDLFWQVSQMINFQNINNTQTRSLYDYGRTIQRDNPSVIMSVTKTTL